MFIVDLVYGREIRIKADKHIKEGDRYVFYTASGQRVDDVLCEIVKQIRGEDDPTPFASAGASCSPVSELAASFSSSGEPAKTQRHQKYPQEDDMDPRHDSADGKVTYKDERGSEYFYDKGSRVYMDTRRVKADGKVTYKDEHGREFSFDRGSRVYLDEAATAASPPSPNTLLLQAASKHNEAACAACAALLDQGADVNAVDKNGCRVLETACFSGSGAVVSLLLKRGASIYGIDVLGRTLLHHSLRGGPDRLVKARLLLSERPTLIVLGDREGKTPLHYAVNTRDVNLAEMLLASDAAESREDIVDLCDNFGWTALHSASAGADAAMVRLLLAYGANTTIEDITGRTALAIATEEASKVRPEQERRIWTALGRTVEGYLQVAAILRSK